MSHTAKFRKALKDAGFVSTFGPTIFNDKRKNSRRLKLWSGRGIAEAPLAKQWALHDNLRAAFGDSILAMYFTKRGGYGGPIVADSLCIKLKL